MTTAQEHREELIPRPEQTPDALRAALAVIAPQLLASMAAEQTRAMTAAIEKNSLKPLLLFVRHWAATVEIERFPETARELRRAEYLAQISTTPDEAGQYVKIAGDIVRAAHQAVAS